MFSQHDIILWHTHNGDKEFRVLHVYNDEPKMLLVTDNLDDEMGYGAVFHAPQCDCEFIRHGVDVTAPSRGKGRKEHGPTPLNLIKTTYAREDF